MATKTDARGVITTYGYDSQNRLTTISYNVSGATGVASTSTVTYNYSAGEATKGLLSLVTVGSSYSESYSFDTFNRVSSVTRNISGKNYATSYQYTTGGQVTQLSYPSGRAVNIGYDGSGRLASVVNNADSSNYVSAVGYNFAGQMTGWTLGGPLGSITESYGYDAQRMQMTSQTATQDGFTRMSLSYSYQASAGQMGAGSTAGNAGQLMSVGGQESASYTYDNLGRLVTSSQTTGGTSAQRRFAYDRWGNRTGVWDAVSGGNQIQSISLEQSGGAPTNRITSVNNGGAVDSYTYDAAGNVTSDGVNNYQYDAENRIVSVNSGSTATYSYDAQNRRVQTVASGVTTHYVWQGSSMIAEHDGSTGAVLTDYIFAGGRMIARESSGGPRLYYLHDRLSVRAMIGDGQGNNWGIQGTQGHLPYGEAMGGSADKHRFTSYEREASTGLDYAVNRWHSPGVGRFLQADPYRASGGAGVPQSWNRYSYVHNDPINKTDPLGLRFVCMGIPIMNGGEVTDMEELVCSPISGGGGGSGESEVPPEGPIKKYQFCRSRVFGEATHIPVPGGKGNEILPVPTKRATRLAMEAAGGAIDFAAMIAAIWSKESGFAKRPTGDHGPMQLSRWWWDNHRELILEGAYDYVDFNNIDKGRGRPNPLTTPFSGNVRANVLTGGNIIKFLYNHHSVAQTGNWADIPWYYKGNNPDLSPEENLRVRTDYRNQVMTLFPIFEDFFFCIKNPQDIPR